MLPAALVTMAALASIIVPASSASAMEINCSYTTGLSDYVDHLSDGTRCAAGTATNVTPGGAGNGTVRPGEALPGGRSTGTGCSYAMPTDMPDYLYDNGVVSAVTLPGMSYTDSTGTTYTDYRTEYRNSKGEHFADRDVLRPRDPAGKYSIHITDFARSHFPVEIHTDWYCDNERWGEELYSDMRPSATLPESDVIPGAPGAPSTGAVKVTVDSTMARVPRSTTGQYFYRINVTNHDTFDRAGYAVDFDTTQFALTSIITSPRDSSCPAATPNTELCFIPSIGAGQTATFTLLVTLKPTAMTTVSLPARVENFGFSHARRSRIDKFTEALVTLP